MQLNFEGNGSLSKEGDGHEICLAAIVDRDGEKQTEVRAELDSFSCPTSSSHRRKRKL